MEFFQLSETTRACEIDAEVKKNKWRNEWLDPTRAWVAPGPLLNIFFFCLFVCFSVKPKIFTPTHVSTPSTFGMVDISELCPSTTSIMAR